MKAELKIQEGTDRTRFEIFDRLIHPALITSHIIYGPYLIFKPFHLFFADDKGKAGTNMTFFVFPGIPKGVHGTNEISKTSFRVPSDESLDYWAKRFDPLEVKQTGIKEQFGKKTLSFIDFDDQQYELILDEFIKGLVLEHHGKKFHSSGICHYGFRTYFCSYSEL